MIFIKHYNKIMNNFINIKNDKNSIIVANLQEKVKDYARHAFAKNTIKNYQSD